MGENKNARVRWFAIALGVVLPTLVTFVYFYVLADSSPKLQQTAYSLGKCLQFAFPLIWLLFFLRKPIREGGIASDSSGQCWRVSTSIGFGVGMGIAVVAAMYAVLQLMPNETIAKLTESAQEKVAGFGLSSPWLFAGLAVFYALFHSFLEEYYYRWFVFAELRRLMNFVPAMIISGFAFMGHHVLVLAQYFGMTSPFTIFLSLCIAIGGMIWAWQYEKSRSLVGPWVSHLIVDAGIFAIGYQILFA